MRRISEGTNPDGSVSSNLGDPEQIISIGAGGFAESIDSPSSQRTRGISDNEDPPSLGTQHSLVLQEIASLRQALPPGMIDMLNCLMLYPDRVKKRDIVLAPAHVLAEEVAKATSAVTLLWTTRLFTAVARLHIKKFNYLVQDSIKCCHQCYAFGLSRTSHQPQQTLTKKMATKRPMEQGLRFLVKKDVESFMRTVNQPWITELLRRQTNPEAAADSPISSHHPENEFPEMPQRGLMFERPIGEPVESQVHEGAIGGSLHYDPGYGGTQNENGWSSGRPSVWEGNADQAEELGYIDPTIPMNFDMDPADIELPKFVWQPNEATKVVFEPARVKKSRNAVVPALDKQICVSLKAIKDRHEHCTTWKRRALEHWNENILECERGDALAAGPRGSFRDSLYQSLLNAQDTETNKVEEKSKTASRPRRSSVASAASGGLTPWTLDYYMTAPLPQHPSLNHSNTLSVFGMESDFKKSKGEDMIHKILNKLINQLPDQNVADRVIDALIANQTRNNPIPIEQLAPGKSRQAVAKTFVTSLVLNMNGYVNIVANEEICGISVGATPLLTTAS